VFHRRSVVPDGRRGLREFQTEFDEFLFRSHMVRPFESSWMAASNLVRERAIAGGPLPLKSDSPQRLASAAGDT
jgi:hypothetical protein